MRKSFWLAAASAVLLPVMSQAAITFRVEPKTFAPGESGFVNVLVEATGADVGRGFDGFTTTANLNNAATKAVFSGAPSDTTDYPQYQVNNTFPTDATLTSAQYQAAFTGLEAQRPTLPAVAGLMRIPITVLPTAAPGSTFDISLPSGSDTNSLLLIVSGNLTTVLPDTITGSTITVTPEPASLGLLALGGLFGLRRRRSA